MTAPIVSAMTGLGLPTWDLDDGALRIVNGNCLDQLGRRWEVDKHPDGEKGWAAPAGVRPRSEDRPEGHGSFEGTAWRKGRSLTLAGRVRCPTPELREQTEAELAALFSDPLRLCTYRRTTAGADQTVEFRLDDRPDIDPTTIYELAWSFPLYCPDTRKHERGWQEPSWQPRPASSSAGYDFSGGGLDFSGGGADAGAASSASSRATLRVANRGSAPAAPFLTITGPMPVPRIVHLETGATWTCIADVVAGEVVTINFDDFAARGIPAHAALSTLRGDVGPLWTFEPDWPLIDPFTVASFQLASTAAAGSEIKVAVRSASW